MTGVQKGGVGKRTSENIKNGKVRNRSFSDLSQREWDITELKEFYLETLYCMENGERYSDDLLNLQTFIGYCLDRDVKIIPEGSIPKNAPINQLAYADCIGRITAFLLTTGLLEEMLRVDTCEILESAFLEE